MELFGQWTKTTCQYGSRTAENAQVTEPLATSNNMMLTAVSREDMMEWEPTLLSQTQINAACIYNKKTQLVIN
jgi:hypothetical protein